MIVKAIRTQKTNEKKWEDIPSFSLEEKYEFSDTCFIVNTDCRYQVIEGFGGAITESSAYVISKALPEHQKEILQAYYTTSGLNYNLGRISIASSDFSLGNYEYLTSNNLKEFDMSHEEEYLLPLLKKINQLKAKPINYLASPWSPPAFMKTNLERNYGGKLHTDFYELYAKYLITYLQKMREYGVEIWALSVQNEPAAVQTWDSCIYDAKDEKEFVKKFLGPKLLNEFPNIKLLVWDHNRGDILVSRALEIFTDKEAAKYIWGIGNHWYVSDDYDSLTKFHNLFPNKRILFTEGCVEYSIYGNSPLWKNGEHYARNIINDFNNYSTGFIDWNIVLDQKGGPNHVQNYCEAPIIYNLETKEIKYNISYYYIGHFSRYIQPGALRIQTIKSSTNNELHCASFINPNGEIVVVLLNQGGIKEVTLVVDGLGKKISIPNSSITTFIMKGKE